VPYRLSRLEAYLNPWEDPQGSASRSSNLSLRLPPAGYAAWGSDRARKSFFYLPSSHNDFYPRRDREELGLIGIMCVIALYGLFFSAVSGWREGRISRSRKLLITSITLLIILQTVIHMMSRPVLSQPRDCRFPYQLRRKLDRGEFDRGRNSRGH